MNRGCFNEIVIDIKASGTYTVPDTSYGYLGLNLGDTGVWFMGHFLKPYPLLRPDLSGASYTYTDEQGRILNLKNYKINFDNTIVVSAGVDPWIEVTFYYHVD